MLFPYNLTLGFFIVLYFVPLCRNILPLLDTIYRLFKIIITKKQNRSHPLPSFLENLNEQIGTLEYFMRLPRKWFATPVFIYMGLTHFEPMALLLSLGSLIFTMQAETDTDFLAIRLSEWVKKNPTLSASAFFNQAHRGHGPLAWRATWPDHPEVATPKKIDFRPPTKPIQSLRPLWPAMLDTAFLAHTCLRVMNKGGVAMVSQLFDPMASLWGKRVLQYFGASLEVTGAENIQNKLNGKSILIFNHKSQLDFALTFFALSEIKTTTGRFLRPRFITAKDHFLDNPFIYSVMGIGRLIEAVDMVFIERKKKGAGFENLKEAARTLVNKEIEIAIYPQGTRAEGNLDRSGKRRDAGYFTTVPPKDIDNNGGHLRLGTAYLAVEALKELYVKKDLTPLNLVFVGIMGTATTLAKQSMVLQSGTAIEYKIGKPLTLSAELLDEIASEDRVLPSDDHPAWQELIAEIQTAIDEHLMECLDIRNQLKQRFLSDLQGIFGLSGTKKQELENRFDLTTLNNDILYQTLDRLYASPPNDWHPFLVEISRLLSEDTSEKKWKELRHQITEHLFAQMKTRSHGKKVK